MRQSATTWIIIAAIVIVLGTLAVFGFGRSWWWRGDHDGDGGHHEDTSHGRVDGDGHHDERLEPSGELIDGVRVIDMTAR